MDGSLFICITINPLSAEMSIILDALQKSEKERLAQQHNSPAYWNDFQLNTARKSRFWPILGIVNLVVLVVVLAKVFVGQTPISRLLPSIAHEPLAVVAGVGSGVDDSDVGQVAASGVGSDSRLQADKVSESRQWYLQDFSAASTEAPVNQAVRPSVVASTATTSATDEIIRPTALAALTKAPSSEAQEQAILRQAIHLDALPSAQRRYYESIELMAHTYSPDASGRSVIINGQALREGDELRLAGGQQALLVLVYQQGLVVRSQGRSINLALNQFW